MGLSQIVGQVTGKLLAILISDDYLQPFLILLISIIYNAKIFNFFEKTAKCAIKTIIFDINSGVLAQPFKMAFSITMLFLIVGAVLYLIYNELRGIEMCYPTRWVLGFVWCYKNNRKGLTPTNGINPDFNLSQGSVIGHQ